MNYHRCSIPMMEALMACAKTLSSVTSTCVLSLLSEQEKPAKKSDGCKGSRSRLTLPTQPPAWGIAAACVKMGELRK